MLRFGNSADISAQSNLVYLGKTKCFEGGMYIRGFHVAELSYKCRGNFSDDLIALF